MLPQLKRGRIESSTEDRLTIEDLTQKDSGALTADQEFAADVARGLTHTPKQLFPKYFYDEIGSHLFDCICLLPEYYLTRAENEVLTDYADEIIATAIAAQQTTRQREPLALIEMGSGSAQKTRLIIEALLRRQRELHYVPVDISVTALETSARLLLESYDHLRVTAYAGDYYRALARMEESEAGVRPVLALFLGSNIGNFDRDEAHVFMRALRRILRPGDALLLGADLKKDAATLEAAYDDALGVTAAFNLNLLARINRELEADFDLRAFKHVAEYHQDAGRIKIYLESWRAQNVNIRKLDLQIHLAARERIHTENSHKYDAAQLTELGAKTKFQLIKTWHDRARKFSSNLFVATV